MTEYGLNERFQAPAAVFRRLMSGAFYRRRKEFTSLFTKSRSRPPQYSENAYAANSVGYLAAKEQKFKYIAKINKTNRKG